MLTYHLGLLSKPVSPGMKRDANVQKYLLHNQIPCKIYKYNAIYKQIPRFFFFH